MNYSIFTRLQETRYSILQDETKQAYMERIFQKFFEEEDPNGEKQIAEIMGLSYDSCSWNEKKLILKGRVESWMLNPAKTLQGGMMLASIDATISLLIRFVNQTFATPTIQFSINYMRGILAGDDYYIHATINKLGRKIIFVEAQVYTQEGKLASTCTGTFAA